METVFIGDDGLRFTLSIKRYEFPLADKKYDANWLMMHGRIESSVRSWEFTGPCMLTWEYQTLAEWLRRIESPDAEDGVGFIEQMCFLKDVINGEPALVVSFELGTVPQQRTNTIVPENLEYPYPHPEHDLVFPLRLNNINTIADAIEAQLREYPIRVPEQCKDEVPFFITRYDSPLIYVVYDRSGKPVFATSKEDSCRDYFLDTLGYTSYGLGDYLLIELDEIKREGILSSEAIKALEQEGHIVL